MPEYSEEILDSNSISSTDKAGRPIPVTIPIALAPGIKVVYTTRLGGLSARRLRQPEPRRQVRRRT